MFFKCVLCLADSLWSGGFTINQLESIHINIRNGHGKSHFLRVEIVMQGPTFFVVFTDADTLPPPFRIDNYSEVPIQYWQTKVYMYIKCSAIKYILSYRFFYLIIILI